MDGLPHAQNHPLRHPGMPHAKHGSKQPQMTLNDAFFGLKR